MNQKFIIALFATICFNGVYSSPVDDQNQLPGNESPKFKLPTISSVSTDHVSQKPEPASVFTNHSMPVKPMTSHEMPHNKIHQNTTVLLSDKVISSAFNATSGFNSKNEKKTINISQSTDSKINSPPVDSINSVIGIRNGSSSNDPPLENSSSVSPFTNHITITPIVPAVTITTKNSSYSTTLANMVRTTTINPTSTRSTLESVTSNSITAEQNTPAPTGGSHFDGASFIGGIVLTIGLTAIGFIAFKYYKSGRIDMNYRTL